jgi:hypothetical protein
MPGKILLSTAYLPPVDYFSLIAGADEVFIESNENYVKQSYRNRCYLVAPGGKQMLSVPVFEGSRHKIPITQARIDYSKRWQQVHLRALISCYKSSPFFDYYFDSIENIISANHEYLFQLNMSLIEAILVMLNICRPLTFTTSFEPLENKPYDYRNLVHPDKQPIATQKEYYQVFNQNKTFYPNMSIVDLIFNMGPDACRYI